MAEHDLQPISFSRRHAGRLREPALVRSYPRHAAGVRSDAISVAVVGVGGVRGFFGGTLSRSGEDVVFVARAATLEALRERGLRVDSISGES
ncbi:MAG: 2-dehydropantoate 2-reductase N-terminal domain-containing protein [Actinomycetota bacterium]